MNTLLPYSSFLHPARKRSGRRRDLFDALFSDFFDDSAPITCDKIDFAPRVDMHETEEALHLVAELPGVEKDNIKVEVKDNILSISGTKEKRIKEANYSEISSGSFQRSFSLAADTYDIDSIAVRRDKTGVLHVDIPKFAKEQPKERTISISDA